MRVVLCVCLFIFSAIANSATVKFKASGVFSGDEYVWVPSAAIKQIRYSESSKALTIYFLNVLSNSAPKNSDFSVATMKEAEEIIEKVFNSDDQQIIDMTKYQ